MSAHTPGPWKAIDNPVSDEACVYEAGSGDLVCAVSRGLGGKPDPANGPNARLIAAAPELLAELMALVAAIAEAKLELGGHVGLDDARAAIAKAERG